jgi:hypothetical protein
LVREGTLGELAKNWAAYLSNASLPEGIMAIANAAITVTGTSLICKKGFSWAGKSIRKLGGHPVWQAHGMFTVTVSGILGAAISPTPYADIAAGYAIATPLVTGALVVWHTDWFFR